MSSDHFTGFSASQNGKDGRAKSDVAIMGLPYDLGATTYSGQRNAPTAIRTEMIYPAFRSNAHGVEPLDRLRIVDVGDIWEHHPQTADSALALIKSEISRILPNTRVPILLGGDQSVSAYAAVALAEREREQITVIHFDSYPDVERPSVGTITQSSWVRFAIESGTVLRVVQFGIRGWGIKAADALWATKNDVEFFAATRQGVLQALQREIADTPGKIFMSIDMSVLDASAAPGVAFPEPGGITSRELLSMIHIVASSDKFVGADVTEVIPQRDHGGITIKAAAACVAQIITGLAGVQA